MKLLSVLPFYSTNSRLANQRGRDAYKFVKHLYCIFNTNISGAVIKNVVHGYLYIVYIHFVFSFKYLLLFLVNSSLHNL